MRTAAHGQRVTEPCERERVTDAREKERVTEACERERVTDAREKERVTDARERILDWGPECSPHDSVAKTKAESSPTAKAKRSPRALPSRAEWLRALHRPMLHPQGAIMTEAQ